MNYIFISPNYPSGHWRYVAALRAAGHTVLGIGDAGEETFPAMLRGSLNEYYRVGDLHDYDSVYRACAWLISRHGRPDTIEALNPYWCDLVAALNMEFTGELPGVSEFYAEQTACLAECGELLPECELPANVKKAAEFAERVGYPVLAVPAWDKSLNRHIIDNEAQLKALYKGAEKGAWLLFAQYAGEPVSIDGLCALDENEQETLVAVTAHCLTDAGWYGISLSDSQRARVLDLVDSTVECGFFHIDAVRLTKAISRKLPKDELLFNNIIDAPPCELMVDCMSAEFGCDLRGVWAQGEEIDQPLEQKTYAGVACRGFDSSYKNPHEKILRRLNIKLAAHGKPIASGDGCKDYYYLFTGETPAELRRYIKFITEDFAKCQ